jgi:phosphinothricin acetyltransferase
VTRSTQAGWFQRVAKGCPILIASDGSGVVGAAWAGPWRGKPAYATSVETTVYVASGSARSGVGARLYEVLVDERSRGGIHRCYAVIALPNDASVALHLTAGFVEVGVLNEVGSKDGRFVSTLLLELRL